MAGNSRADFNHKAVLGFSIVQLVAGCFGVVLGICLIFFSPGIGFIATGIWCGLMFNVTSILGFTSWKYKNNCNIIALMVLCIISAVLAFIGLSIQISSIVSNTQWHFHEAVFALDSFLGIVFLVELIISIVCSAFCCRAVCCGQRSPAGQIVVYAPVQPNQQQVIMPTSGCGGQLIGFGQVPVAPPAYMVTQNPTLAMVGAQSVDSADNSREDEKGSKGDGDFGYGQLNNDC